MYRIMVPPEFFSGFALGKLFAFKNVQIMSTNKYPCILSRHVEPIFLYFGH